MKVLGGGAAASYVLHDCTAGTASTCLAEMAPGVVPAVSGASLLVSSPPAPSRLSAVMWATSLWSLPHPFLITLKSFLIPLRNSFASVFPLGNEGLGQVSAAHCSCAFWQFSSSLLAVVPP